MSSTDCNSAAYAVLVRLQLRPPKTIMYHKRRNNGIPMTNRPVCDVLEEMRECFKHFNFALLPSLIEEVQLAVNRMESKLWDLKDWEQLKDDIRERRLELKRIKEEKEKMEDAIENMRGMKSI